MEVYEFESSSFFASRLLDRWKLSRTANNFPGLGFRV